MGTLSVRKEALTDIFDALPASSMIWDGPSAWLLGGWTAAGPFLQDVSAGRAAGAA